MEESRLVMLTCAKGAMKAANGSRRATCADPLLPPMAANGRLRVRAWGSKQRSCSWISAEAEVCLREQGLTSSRAPGRAAQEHAGEAVGRSACANMKCEVSSFEQSCMPVDWQGNAYCQAMPTEQDYRCAEAVRAQGAWLPCDNALAASQSC